MNPEIITCLQEFMEHEARSCSMEPGCITPVRFPEGVWPFLLAEGIDVGASGETNLFWGNLQVIDTCKKIKIIQP